MTNHLAFTALLSILVSGCLTAETPAESVATGESDIDLVTPEDPDLLCGPSAEAFAFCQDTSDTVRTNCRNLVAQGQAQLDYAIKIYPTLPPSRQGAAYDLIRDAKKELALWYQGCDKLAADSFQNCLADACEAAVAF